MAQIRLLLDEDTQVLLAPSLRDAGYDAKHVLEVGMSRTHDPDVLAYAASQGRVVFSHNAKDFMPLAQAYTRTRRAHAGARRQLEWGTTSIRTVHEVGVG